MNKREQHPGHRQIAQLTGAAMRFAALDRARGVLPRAWRAASGRMERQINPGYVRRDHIIKGGQRQ
jgi:hypothetical protein